MNTFQDKNIQLLNDLIETCRDGRQGYATVAMNLRDPELGRAFAHYTEQRASYLRELQERVRTLGGDPEKPGSVSGALQRGWNGLKAALTTSAPHVLLAECERGEDSTVANYREALQQPALDSETRSIVQRQAAGVRAAHDRIKQLRESVAYAHR